MTKVATPDDESNNHRRQKLRTTSKIRRKIDFSSKDNRQAATTKQDYGQRSRSAAKTTENPGG